MNFDQISPELEALKAQAVAARTFANWWGPVLDNSTNYQVFIPGTHDNYPQSYQDDVNTALNTTQGQFLSAGDGLTINAMFGSEAGDHTEPEPGKNYLITVQEPNFQASSSSEVCGITRNYSGKGMSQRGAIRWAKGNTCPDGTGADWPVKWDYKQILAHYYTGIDFVDDNTSAKLAPDDRWNLLNHNVPVEVQPGQAITLTIQNTSTTDWDEDVSLNWTLAESCRTADSTPDASWNEIALDVNHGHKGEAQDVTITIPALAPGIYTLHVDMKRNSTNAWFRNGEPGGWPYAQIPVQVGSMPILTTVQGQVSSYPYGLTGCYYNDTAPGSFVHDAPINWETLTNFVTAIPNQDVFFGRRYPLTSPVSGVNNTFWSARWVGKIYVTKAENYTFYLALLDDGGRLFIDNINEDALPVIESWLVQGAQPDPYPSQPIYLDVGLHDIRVDYAQGPFNNSSLFVEWSSESSPLRRILFRSALPPATVALPGNVGVPGATLYYIDGVAKSVTADASGNYSLVVPYGWSGAVTPSLAGYIFEPASISHPATYADQVSSNFTPTSVGAVTVTNTNDSGSGSLREAITNPDTGVGATIVFAPELSGQTIHLNSTLIISKNVTIDGSMLASPVTLSGGSAHEVLKINTGVTAILKNLTITNGMPGIKNSGSLTLRNSNIAGNSPHGIGNSRTGDLTIIDSILADNTAGENMSGGGIENEGSLTIVGSTFSNNAASRYGGGIYNTYDGSLVVMSSTFANNTAASGGGIYNATGQMSVANSTFSGNAATSQGGGIYHASPYPEYVTVTNSTFANNSASQGGGIFNSGSNDTKGFLVLTNSTFSGNLARSEGGGIYTNSLLYYANSILANSTGGECVNGFGGTITTNINNLVEDGSCPDAGENFQSGSDPSLGVLGSNGGPTQTLALLPGSPALDAGDNILCAQSPVNNRDQRGVQRTHDAQCDLGAYEYYIDPAIPTVDAFSAPPTSTSRNIPITAFSASDDVNVTGFMITVSPVPPAYGEAGWLASAPSVYEVSADGIHTLYPWVKDADGNVSSVSSFQAIVTVDSIAPRVLSIRRMSANPTSAASVEYQVMFSEPVTGVDASDFSLTISGISGASVTSVSGSGDTYVVTVNTGHGDGTLRLDVMNAVAIITDLLSNPLWRSFNTGEVYTVSKYHQ